MKKQTKKTALCGVLGALSITFLLMGFLFPFATYVSPALAASLLIIVVYEYGIKTGLTLFTAVSGKNIPKDVAKSGKNALTKTIIIDTKLPVTVR